MDSTALHALFRAEVRDDTAPYLWADSEVYAFMDDAQKMFCRLGGGIADAVSPITSLPAPAGQEYVEFSPLILKIREAHRADGRDLDILNFEDIQFGNTGLVSDYGWQPRHADFSSKTGELRAVVTGMDATHLRLLDAPAADDTVSLIVYRLPLNEIGGEDVALEIGEQHHRHLLLWMKYLAHQKQDAETLDQARATSFQQQFYAYCAAARAEREKLEHKYRTVAYGGI